MGPLVEALLLARLDQQRPLERHPVDLLAHRLRPRHRRLPPGRFRRAALVLDAGWCGTAAAAVSLDRTSMRPNLTSHKLTTDKLLALPWGVAKVTDVGGPRRPDWRSRLTAWRSGQHPVRHAA
jgi:hypothetical protein